MRWRVIQEAWKMAREKFPKVERLYVEIPRKFRSHGSCLMYDLGEGSSPIGEMAYDTTCVDGRPEIRLQIGEESRSVEASQSGTARLKVSSRIAPVGEVAGIDADLMEKRYPDPLDLGKQAARLFSSGSTATRVEEEEVEGWLSANGFRPELMAPVTEGLRELGVQVAFPAVYNLKTSKRGFKFEEHQRVRVVDPTSMEYQECGRVVERKGNSREGFSYLVLVDGSQDPVLFMEQGLEQDEAGIILEPIPEPIDDKERV